MKRSKVIAVLVCAALLAGCQTGKEQDRSDEDIEETTEETAAEEPAASDAEPAGSSVEPASEVNIIYDGLIDRLRTVRAGDADDNAIMELAEQVSYDYIIAPEDAQIFYSTVDIDSNGVDELIIYENQMNDAGPDKPVIYDAYTVENGELVHFIAGGARNAYYLADDGSFYNLGSSGAAYTAFAHYAYSSGVITLIDTYFTDDSSGAVEWYYSTTGIWGDDKTSASADDAEAFMNDFECMFIANANPV